MLIGHQKQWQFLTKSAELGKLSHAYLFSGQEKLGKRTLAIELAKLLLGEDVEKKQHPDFIFIEPIDPPTKQALTPKVDGNGQGLAARGDQISKVSPRYGRGTRKEIQIFQIREAIWKLSLKPSVSRFKLAIIDQAQWMNSEAQNCLLKTLEEPKGDSLLILIAEYPEMLFPTVRSRLQKIKFYPVEDSEIKNYLKEKGVKDEELEEIVKFCLGKPGRAVDLLLNPKELEKQRKAVSDLIKISKSDLALRLQYAKDLSENLKALKETLEIWLRYFRDTLIRGNFSDKLINVMKTIQKTNRLISSTNVSPRLALEILMLEL